MPQKRYFQKFPGDGGAVNLKGSGCPSPAWPSQPGSPIHPLPVCSTPCKYLLCCCTQPWAGPTRHTRPQKNRPQALVCATEGVFTSCGCRNKSPQTDGLTQQEFIFAQFWRSRSEIKVSVGCAPSAGSQGRAPSSACPTSGGCRHSMASLAVSSNFCHCGHIARLLS